ncbi:MAG: sulfatase-like hydrolase/transferase [Actinomycetota bacterium]
MRPNILWIVFDTARADAFEPYGASAGSSPVVADLARRGGAVAGVRSTACWTVPAHVSMFAGGMPRGLGFARQAGLTPGNAEPIVAALRERLIAEVLRRSGYRTGAISANGWVSRRGGFAVGFERFVDRLKARRVQAVSETRIARGRWMAEAALARGDDGAREAGARLRAWISKPPAGPFFWFVNLVECHSPYLPPRSHTELSLQDRIRAAREARVLLTLDEFWRACITGTVPPTGAIERMRAGYRGAVRYMDDWLGRVLEQLAAATLLDETLVILSSDHGENFGEGGLIGHGFSLDERLIEVPFVTAGPGSERLRDVRSLAEVPRRLAEIAEVANHPYDVADTPRIPVAQFDPPAPPRGDPRTDRAIALWDLDEPAVERLTTPMTAAVDGTLKLLRRGDTEEFYDLEADPLEGRPTDAGRLDGASVERLRAAVSHPAVVATEARLDTKIAPPPEVPDHELAEIEDRLRLLGYL